MTFRYQFLTIPDNNKTDKYKVQSYQSSSRNSRNDSYTVGTCKKPCPKMVLTEDGLAVGGDLLSLKITAIER